MAPTRTAKRAAETAPAEEPALKKLAPTLRKNGVSQATFKQIAEVLDHPMASYLPADCKKMLLAMLPQSLCVPSDQREEPQNLAVKMMGEVVVSIEQKLKQAVDDESAKVSDVENSKATLSESRAVAEAALEAKKSVVAAAQSELHNSSEAVIVAKAAAAKSEEAHREFDASLTKALAEKAEMEGALSGDFQILKVGEWKDSPNPHIQAIQPLLSKLSMDESLKTAQQSVLTKKPTERGGFDMTVIDELDKCFEAKIQELAHFLESGKSQRAAKAAPVAEDAAARDAAELQQKDCSNRLLEAKQAQKEAAAALKEAEAALESFEPTLKAATAVRDANQQELQIFLDNAVASFHQLKDRISAKKQRELAAQAKAEAEAKAQAEAEALAAEKAAAEQAAAEAKPAEDDVSKQEAVPMITEETAPAKQMEEVTAGEMEARVIRLGGGGC